MPAVNKLRRRADDVAEATPLRTDDDSSAENAVNQTVSTDEDAVFARLRAMSLLKQDQPENAPEEIDASPFLSDADEQANEPDQLALNPPSTCRMPTSRQKNRPRLLLFPPRNTVVAIKIPLTTT